MIAKHTGKMNVGRIALSIGGNEILRTGGCKTSDRTQAAEVLANKCPFVNELMDDVQDSMGVDGEWDGKETPRFIRLYNSFHIMDDVGWYVGYADFCVLIPKKSPMDFTIQYRNARSRYLAGRYLATDYLVDMFLDGMVRALMKCPVMDMKCGCMPG